MARPVPIRRLPTGRIAAVLAVAILGASVPAIAAALFGSAAAAAAEAAPVEPDGYRMDDFRTPTPETLKGARVVDTDPAYDLWAGRDALFVDVLPRAPKPANLPPGTIWRDKPRANIPGSIWLANVGYGALSPEMDRYFRAGLQAITGGDKSRPIVFYCLADCWMSWNAARRAMLEYGYSNVTWFPGGTDGWAEMNFPTEKSEPWIEGEPAPARPAGPPPVKPAIVHSTQSTPTVSKP